MTFSPLPLTSRSIIETVVAVTLLVGAPLARIVEVTAQPRVSPAPPRFEGVASCSASNCHGSAAPLTGSKVAQNEYLLWQKHDLHSRAFENLLGESGKRIGHNLGIQAPERENLCLDCHATNAPVAQRGEKFQITDGVGCESCHGAAEHYLRSHTVTNSSHQENLRNGMRDLVNPQSRAAYCVTCHLGASDKVVNHRLIAAGHPRLTFELDTFSIIQPKHWVIDDDYRSRKGAYVSAKAWLIGQIENAKNSLQALESPTRSKDGIWPEFTLMYCYSCHHSLSEEQWKTREYGGHPGKVRLNTASLTMVNQAFHELDPDTGREIESGLSSLHDRFEAGTGAAAARALLNTLERAQTRAERLAFHDENLHALLRSIANLGATTMTPPYEVAEQIAMALQSIAATIDRNGKLSTESIDAIYKTLETPHTFQPKPFTEACRALREKLATR